MREAAGLHERSAQQLADQLGAVSQRLDTAVQGVADSWQAALQAQAASGEQQSRQMSDTLAAHASLFERQAQTLLSALSQAQSGLQQELAARDAERLGAWTQALAAQADTLRQQWQAAGEATLAQQQRICGTLEDTAERMAAQSQAHARDTIAEINRLVDAAAEAPRAAAELVGQLRQQLSDSLVRDNATLAERERLLGTLDTVLEAVQGSAARQQGALDALLSASADWLARTQAQVGERLDGEAQRLEQLGAQLSGSAVEVASLGEAFGAAVQGFQLSTQQLAAQMQRIEEALSRSMARSDEQLAYYVAQAREVIDLSLLSHKRIVDDLQRIAGQREEAA